MRALRSRPISDNTDNESNEDGNNIKRKKSKKYLPDVSEENVDKSSEDRVVKKKPKKSKKHAKENINSSVETVLQEIRVNTENSSENEDHSKKRLKKKKSKKLKKSQDENNLSTSAQSTEIETEVSSNEKLDNSSEKSKKTHAKENINSPVETVLQEIRVNTENSSENENHSKKQLKKKKSKKLKKSQDENNSTTAQSTEIETELSANEKLDNSSENNENLIRSLNKKSKKGRKLQDDKHIPENSSENDEVSKQHVTKKSKKLKKSQSENQSTTTVLNTSVEMEEKSFKLKRHLRSTIACSPNFNNAVTSTLLKPSRRQLTELNVSEIGGNVASPRLNRLTRQKRMSESINMVNTRQETPLKNKTVDKIKDSSLIKSRKSLEFSPRTNAGNETQILQRSARSSRGSSLLSTSFKNSSVLINSKIKQDNNKIPESLTNITTSVIAISDSPDVSQVNENTFNKSESTSGEDTLIENSKKEESLPIISPTNRRETFNLSKNKYLLDGSIITISDTPDKTTKRSTFNKTEVESESEKTFNKSNRSTRSSKSNESTLTKDQSMNQTNIKSPVFGLDEIGNSILENTLDIPETPEKTNNSVLKNNTYELEANTSGDWKVEKNDKIDESKSNIKVENKENQNDEINKSPPKIADQSIRKKWLKFARHSTDAKQVLDQISSPKLLKKMNASLVQKMMNTPKELYNLQKPSIAPSNLSLQSKSAKKSPIVIKKSPMKSAKKVIGNSSKKSASKRTVMPNFALIHQKAFDKMENLKEYSERKEQRAQALLSSKKPESARKSTKTTDTKTEEPKSKSSRQLFNNDCKMAYTRFGFKTTECKPLFSAKPETEKKVQIVKPVIKPSVFARSDVVAIANKKVVTKSRENKRDILKGVRTNRRFELLMQMRNK